MSSTNIANRSARTSVDDPILEVRDASVTFEMDRGSSRVLDNVSIDIERQELIGIVGESGSGKSMFASSLLDAVVDPGRLTGSIRYQYEDGEWVDVLDLNPNELQRFRWEQVSMVFQGALSAFNPVIEIRTHFEETLEAHNQDIEEGMELARDLLSDLYLDPDRVLGSYPHELSGGMKQRAFIALSLILEPNVLVMDEPTAALDLLMQRSILALLDEIKEKYDITVIFITHDLPLVAEIADRIAVMYAFEFVEIGEANEIINHATHPYTRSLLNSVPNLNAPLDEMEPIEGASPDPVNVPTGCSYHPRCSLAQEQCRAEDPPLLEVGEDHTSACFFWEDAVEEIPLVHVTEGETSETIRGKQTEDPVISLDDVEVYFTESTSILNIFADPDIIRAVDGVDLDIYGNDVVALVGESGCGKTTLGKTAIGLEEPTNGSVRYRGNDIWNIDGEVSLEEIRTSLQIIHQDPGSSLNPYRSILHTLEVPLKRWQPQLSGAERRARIMGMLEEVGMTPAEDYANRYPLQLSGGEKQRVALIRALLMNPDLILADEAVSALDVSLRVEMMDLLLEMLDLFETSYLFISHDLSNARYLAGKADGRIGVMYLGQLVEIGPVEEVINNPKHPYTKALRWSTADLGKEEKGDPPIRSIDIPDPINPPTGCRFHPRCPEAREACTKMSPNVENARGAHHAACFMEADDDHPYWDSDPLPGTEDY